MSLVKKQKDVVFHYSYIDTFRALVDAIRNAGMCVDFCNENAGVIKASKSVTLWSWGEEIELNLRPEAPNATSIHITSDSKLGTTLIDWGVNNKNINKILDGANQLLAIHYGR